MSLLRGSSLSSSNAIGKLFIKRKRAKFVPGFCMDEYIIREKRFVWFGPGYENENEAQQDANDTL